MKLSHCLPVLLSVCLAACGGGGGNNGASGNEGGTVTAPTPPVTLRGTLIGAAAPVAQVYNGASVATLSPAALSALLNASFSGTTILTGNPTCSVTLHGALPHGRLAGRGHRRQHRHHGAVRHGGGLQRPAPGVVVRARHLGPEKHQYGRPERRRA